MPKQIYRLPNGRPTKNVDLYVKEWRKLMGPWRDHFDLTGSFAFDPGISFSVKGRYDSIYLDADVAQFVYKIWKENQKCTSR